MPLQENLHIWRQHCTAAVPQSREFLGGLVWRLYESQLRAREFPGTLDDGVIITLRFRSMYHGKQHPKRVSAIFSSL